MKKQKDKFEGKKSVLFLSVGNERLTKNSEATQCLKANNDFVDFDALVFSKQVFF